MIPTETQDQIALVKYLELLKAQGKILLFSHVPQETYTKSWGVKMMNKKKGVRKGVPDLIIITDTTVLFLELKRLKGGSISPEQKQWNTHLHNKQTQAHIAKGFDQAKKIIDTYINS